MRGVGNAVAAQEEEKFPAWDEIMARWAASSRQLTLSTPSYWRLCSEALAVEAARAKPWELDVVSVN